MTHELQWPLRRWVYAVNTKSIITIGISLTGHPAVGKTHTAAFIYNKNSLLLHRIYHFTFRETLQKSKMQSVFFSKEN